MVCVWSISGGSKSILHAPRVGVKNGIAWKDVRTGENKPPAGKRKRSLGCHDTYSRKGPEVDILPDIPYKRGA